MLPLEGAIVIERNSNILQYSHPPHIIFIQCFQFTLEVGVKVDGFLVSILHGAHAFNGHAAQKQQKKVSKMPLQ